MLVLKGTASSLEIRKLLKQKKKKEIPTYVKKIIHVVTGTLLA